jgi:hypothetical protein
MSAINFGKSGPLICLLTCNGTHSKSKAVDKARRHVLRQLFFVSFLPSNTRDFLFFTLPRVSLSLFLFCYFYIYLLWLSFPSFHLFLSSFFTYFKALRRTTHVSFISSHSFINGSRALCWALTSSSVS